MKNTLVLIIVASLFMFCLGSIASAVTIDFESNEPYLAQIGGYYSGEGVVFDNSWGWYDNTSNYPGNSGTRSTIALENPLDATIDFVNTVSQVSAYFNVYQHILSWRAYSTTNKLLGEVTMSTTSQPTPGGMQVYTLPYDNISKVVLTGQQGIFFSMDDLTFSPSSPVPEPTTFALLGIGLVGLTGAEVRRRRKKKAVDKS